ncbi:hypothetical protein M527_14495 [Sphingobium indicum IP26]|nr:hypothetical protein M527_14495 [Sphingobium indicum IP26]
MRGIKVAIIGLGGTGAYILDFIARTHLEKIGLFDDDKVHIHTLFRIPGFIHRAVGMKKVDALAHPLILIALGVQNEVCLSSGRTDS